MGMFDTVHFKCPKCGGKVAIQTKGGTCDLKNYHSESVPLGAASGLVSDCDTDPDPETCEHCGVAFVVRAQPARVRLWLEIPAGEDGDWD